MNKVLLSLVCALIPFPWARAEENPAAPTPAPLAGDPQQATPSQAGGEPAKKEDPSPQTPGTPGPAEEALKKTVAEQEQLMGEFRKKIEQLEAQIQKLKEENAALNAQLQGKNPIKIQDSIQKLIANFRGTTSERFKAIEELIKIGKPAVPFLIEATRNEHFYIRQSSVQTLGDIEDSSSVPALLDVISGDNPDLASYANRSLSKITHQYFGTLGIGESEEEKKAVIDNWKKWWVENSGKLPHGPK